MPVNFWGGEEEGMKLTENLYAYFWQSVYENNCNTYIIDVDKTVLIDPGHSRYLPKLFDQMERDGISPERIDLIIATHSHPDHLEGIEAFLDKPVKLAIGLEEDRYLHEAGQHLYEMMGQSLPTYRMDLFLKEGQLLLGKEAFQIYQTPGHSPGSITIYWPKRKVLFTGDLIFYGGIGRTDFLGGNSGALMESIERMSRLEIEMLLPGHGEAVIGREMVLHNFEFIRQNYFPYL